VAGVDGSGIDRTRNTVRFGSLGKEERVREKWKKDGGEERGRQKLNAIGRGGLLERVVNMGTRSANVIGSKSWCRETWRFTDLRKCTHERSGARLPKRTGVSVPKEKKESEWPIVDGGSNLKTAKRLGPKKKDGRFCKELENQKKKVKGKVEEVREFVKPVPPQNFPGGGYRKKGDDLTKRGKQSVQGGKKKKGGSLIG